MIPFRRLFTVARRAAVEDPSAEDLAKLKETQSSWTSRVEAALRKAPKGNLPKVIFELRKVNVALRVLADAGLVMVSCFCRVAVVN